MDRLLRDAAGQANLLTYDATGALADVNGGSAPTVVVTDSAGTVVPGFTGVRDSTGTYHAALPANLEVLDVYSVAWNFANAQSRYTAFELVGGFLFTIADVLALGAPFSTMTPAQIAQARSEVETIFEDPNITGRAFRPRGRRVTLEGTGTASLWVPDYDITRIVAATIDGVAANLNDLEILPHGTLRFTSGTWTPGNQNVMVLYEFGFPSPPADVRREALTLVRSYLNISPVDDQRMTAVFTDVGGYRVTIAGRDGWTGIPTVDACLSRYSLVKAGLVG